MSLIETNDAQKWASEFCRIKQEQNWTLDDIDEGLMISWFANAMYAQEIKTEPRITASESVYGFAAWLTSRKSQLIVSAHDDASLIAELVKKWCELNYLKEPRQGIYPDNITMPKE